MDDVGKNRPPKDKRSEAQKQEDSLRNSAAVRGISFEEMVKILEGKQKPF